jgi:hypothetical protein
MTEMSERERLGRLAHEAWYRNGRDSEGNSDWNAVADAIAAEVRGPLEAVVNAAVAYRDAARNANAVWAANGRRGASVEATTAVNAARMTAKIKHDEMMRAIDAYANNGSYPQKDIT